MPIKTASPKKAAKRTLAPTRSRAYRAGGRRIVIQPDRDVVGIDVPALNASQRRQILAISGCEPRPLRNGIALLGRDILPTGLVESLQANGALKPVFKSQGARLVALPEVRVEESSGSPSKADLAIRSVRRWLDRHTNRAEIVDQRPDRLVLRPLSGSGADAVTLAEDIARAVVAVSATPRFLRILDQGDS